MEWIKICLSGNNPVMGTIQGRVEDLDAESLNALVANNKPFKLYDVIVIQPAQQPDGSVSLGVAKLTEGMMPFTEGDFIWVHPSNITWWAPIKDDPEWRNVIAQAIHGISLGTSNDLNNMDRGDSGLIIP